jgi:hypothetical protein
MVYVTFLYDVLFRQSQCPITICGCPYHNHHHRNPFILKIIILI